MAGVVSNIWLDIVILCSDGKEIQYRCGKLFSGLTSYVTNAFFDYLVRSQTDRTCRKDVWFMGFNAETSHLK